jgi:hypothetical protein
MSDFIIPGDIYAMAEQTAKDIDDAWGMLLGMALNLGIPSDMVERNVNLYVFHGYSRLEAIRLAYHDLLNL